MHSGKPSCRSCGTPREGNYTCFNGCQLFESLTVHDGLFLTCLSACWQKDDIFIDLCALSQLSFGSNVRGNRTGIHFNDEMDDFSTPGTYNSFGVPASPSNYIEPGKMPMSSMSPMLVFNRDGEVVLASGGSGGTRITTATAWVSERSCLWVESWPLPGCSWSYSTEPLHRRHLPALWL